MKILATDLDRTLLPNGSWESDSEAINLFNELTEINDVLIVYVTGRNLALTENAIKEYGVRYPDILCGDVGTTIRKYENGEWKFDDGWVDLVKRESPKWDAMAIRNAITGIDGIREQEAEHQNQFKQSYYVEHEKNDQVWAELLLSDTGKGIPKNELENIFNRFYRAEIEKSGTGFGIGLAVTRNLVELHKGKIEVTSAENKGTTFRIIIPLSESFYLENEKSIQLVEPIVNEEEKSDVKIIVQPKDTKSQDARIKLLLVDDNSDFRNILRIHFSKQFHVEESEDGVQALKKAIEIQPDIIVSDVMMPGLNGYELCKKLKNNIDTKYIPVILLTAKKLEEEKAQGYIVGADSYITKPVSLQVLESRINALLLKHHEFKPFQKLEIITEAKYPKLTSDELLSKVEGFIFDNLSDPELAVNDLSEFLGMSDSMAYRKIKLASNLSPVELISKIRLNTAANMLLKEKLNISEVAYSTGFSDQSYFTQCFKKKFGLTPSEYITIRSKRKVVIK